MDQLAASGKKLQETICPTAVLNAGLEFFSVPSQVSLAKSAVKIRNSCIFLPLLLASVNTIRRNQRYSKIAICGNRAKRSKEVRSIGIPEKKSHCFVASTAPPLYFAAAPRPGGLTLCKLHQSQKRSTNRQILKQIELKGIDINEMKN